MSKNRIIVGILLSSFLLVGCENEDITLSEASDEINLEVSWWGTDARTDYTINALEQYELNYPGIKINNVYGEFSGFELKNDVKMYTKTESDVMQINYAWVDKYQKEGYGFYDLNNLSNYVDLSNYNEQELSYGRNKDGEQVALPIAINAKIVLYNKSIYDSYNLQIPKTWDDLYVAAEVMKKDNIYPIDLDTTCVWMGMVAYVEQKNGAMVFDEKNQFSLSEKDIKDMLLFYVDLVEHKVIESASARNDQKVSEGLYAGEMLWISGIGNFEKAITERGNSSSVALSPQLSNSKRSGWYIKPATMYAISKNTKNPDEAGKLLNYLVSGEDIVKLQLNEKGVPCNKKATKILADMGEANSLQNEANDLVKETEYPLMSPYFENTKYSEALVKGATKILYGNGKIDEVAKETYKAMKEIQ